jgi:hypothetical protein
VLNLVRVIFKMFVQFRRNVFQATKVQLSGYLIPDITYQLGYPITQEYYILWTLAINKHIQ